MHIYNTKYNLPLYKRTTFRAIIHFTIVMELIVINIYRLIDSYRQSNHLRFDEFQILSEINIAVKKLIFYSFWFCSVLININTYTIQPSPVYNFNCLTQCKNTAYNRIIQVLLKTIFFFTQIFFILFMYSMADPSCEGLNW